MVTFTIGSAKNSVGTLRLVEIETTEIHHGDTFTLPIFRGKRATILFVKKGEIRIGGAKESSLFSENTLLLPSRAVLLPVESASEAESASCLEITFDLTGAVTETVFEEKMRALRTPDIILLARQLAQHETDSDSAITESLLLSLLLICEEAASLVTDPRAGCYEQVCRYIDEHIAESLGVEEIASALHYHPDYLNRVFRKEQNITLKKYISMARLSFAKQLLATTNLPCREIAAKMHFPSVALFLKFFKYHAGITPTEYRDGFGAQMI